MIKIVIKYELVVYNEQYQLLFLTSMIDTFLLPLCEVLSRETQHSKGAEDDGTPSQIQ